MNRKERSHDTENHCGYLIILDLAKSPFVNTVVNKVEPMTKPKTSLKFFVNTTKPKTKVLAGYGQKLETKVLTLSLSPG